MIGMAFQGGVHALLEKQFGGIPHNLAEGHYHIVTDYAADIACHGGEILPAALAGILFPHRAGAED